MKRASVNERLQKVVYLVVKAASTRQGLPNVEPSLTKPCSLPYNGLGVHFDICRSLMYERVYIWA